MSRVNNVQGFQRFCVGLILLAGTGFTSLLNLPGMLSAAFVCIDAVALIVMNVGVASVKKTAPVFSGVQTILVLDAAITLGIALILAMTNSLDVTLLVYANFILTTLTKVLDLIAVFMVLRGCKRMLAHVDKYNSQKSIYGFSWFYLIVMIAVMVAYAVIAIWFSGNYTFAVYVVGGLVVIYFVMNLLAVGRISKIKDAWNSRDEQE